MAAEDDDLTMTARAGYVSTKWVAVEAIELLARASAAGLGTHEQWGIDLDAFLARPDVQAIRDVTRPRA